MYDSEPNEALVQIWSGIVVLLLRGFTYVFLVVSLGLIWEDKTGPVTRQALIYLNCLIAASIVGVIAFEKCFANTRLHTAVAKRARYFPGLFLTEIVLAGFAPAFVVTGWLSRPVFGVFLGAVLVFSLLVSLFGDWDGGPGKRILTFLDATALSFYLGLAPLYLGLFLWTRIQRVYQHFHVSYGMSLGGFSLLAVVAVIALVLNVLLLVYLAGSRDLSGAYAPSFRARWVTIHTKEFVRQATRAEAGEWSAPMRTLPKFIIVNGLLAVITAIAVANLGAYLPFDDKWKYLVSYTVLLALAVVWYFVKARRLVNT